MTKHIAFCVVMVFVFGTIMTVSADVPKDLMIYLPFDEKSGTTAKDLSNSKYVGKLKDGAKFVGGKVNNAVEMVGGKSVVTVEDFNLAPLKGTNQITIGAWFKVIKHNQWDGVVSIEAEGGECCEFRLMLNQDAAPKPFWNMGHHKDRTGKFVFAMNRWYHYAMTYDGKKARIYVDGKETESSDENVKLPTGKGLFMVGAGEAPGTWAMESGIIDEVFVSNRQLKADEIGKVMKEGLLTTAVAPKDKLTTMWSDIKRRR